MQGESEVGRDKAFVEKVIVVKITAFKNNARKKKHDRRKPKPD